MTPNNLSRKIFNDFVTNKGLTRLPNKNVFIHKGDKCVFTLCASDQIEARQFYTDCTFLYAYVPADNRVYVIHRDDLKRSTRPTRISPKGEFALNAWSDDPTCKTTSVKFKTKSMKTKNNIPR